MELDGNEYRSLGTQEHLDFEEKKNKVYSVLTDLPRTVDAIAADAGLPTKATAKALEVLCNEGNARRQGKGVRNDPHLYCRPAEDSFPSQPSSIGKESNSVEPTLSGHDNVLAFVKERASQLMASLGRLLNGLMGHKLNRAYPALIPNCQAPSLPSGE